MEPSATRRRRRGAEVLGLFPRIELFSHTKHPPLIIDTLDQKRPAKMTTVAETVGAGDEEVITCHILLLNPWIELEECNC